MLAGLDVPYCWVGVCARVCVVGLKSCSWAIMVADLVSVDVACLVVVRSFVLVAVAVMCCACRMSMNVAVFAVVARGAASV